MIPVCYRGGPRAGQAGTASKSYPPAYIGAKADARAAGIRGIYRLSSRMVAGRHLYCWCAPKRRVFKAPANAPAGRRPAAKAIAAHVPRFGGPAHDRP